MKSVGFVLIKVFCRITMFIHCGSASRDGLDQKRESELKKGPIKFPVKSCLTFSSFLKRMFGTGVRFSVVFFFTFSSLKLFKRRQERVCFSSDAALSSSGFRPFPGFLEQLLFHFFQPSLIMRYWIVNFWFHFSWPVSQCTQTDRLSTHWVLWMFSC